MPTPPSTFSPWVPTFLQVGEGMSCIWKDLCGWVGGPEFLPRLWHYPLPLPVKTNWDDLRYRPMDWACLPIEK